jgi:tol-pal system protein YbgF
MTTSRAGLSAKALLLASAFALSGCTIGVQPHSVTSEPTNSAAHGTGQPDRKTPSWKGDIDIVNSKIKKSEEIQKKTLSNIGRRVSLLEKEINELRGNLELAQRNNEQLNGRLTTVENRFTAQKQPAAALPHESIIQPSPVTRRPMAETPVISTPVPAAPQPEIAVATPVMEPAKPVLPDNSRESYESAYQKLLARQFKDSLYEFNRFLSRFPNDILADNAQYWIGELHYVQKQFPESLQAFNNVLVKWPSSPKVPACLLKIGFAFYELGDMQNARSSLTRLVTDYPTSNAVTLANQRLRMIEQRVGGQ